ncbi:hypothetical protein [Vibrio sp. SCSIO 43137]|uniref:hypothetical protein n=1 Tax=Vibrio sp. SCSIO 43137 TaxID=3021011 RepID=UPI002307F84F|nr:hypothetical protein [Vibrio sp. SCSIO 43137]WCE31785.1 hypothetical protein PK654_21915 [Vibrio sp. SCSIO 43137]
MKKLAQIFLLAIMLNTPASAATHFGLGIGVYDDIVHYNDKSYHDTFSWDLGLYSDFNKSHMLFLDAHLYTQMPNKWGGFQTFAYAGIGGIYIQDTDNYVHKHGVDHYEENWGARFPLGLEMIHKSNISIYAEVIPTYIVEPGTKYQTLFTLGIRYYLY